ncbi:MAG: ABC transporter ATP-binding protein [Nitrososphaerota archaeon]|nr:ABC transporter ATP-binding protein [Nitrososphaerota archaeon]MDG7041328.1 ABC transporter ATP-binding protein [Nitrososphaerota archaeon]
MKGIVKEFPGVLAVDHVDFELYPGEIHALLGENGAGKTTLMNVLYGIYKADSGETLINGKPVRINNAVDAQSNRIGMVHQHFSLIPAFTVAENLSIGLKDGGFILKEEYVGSKIKEAEDKYGIHIDVNRKVDDLSIGEQQRVEVLKLLFRGANTLILDEPTSALTPQEAENLFLSLKALKAEGKAIVVITHKLYEVMEIADRVTVLRKGRVVFKSMKAGVTSDILAEAMIGKGVELAKYKKEEVKAEGSLVIEKLMVIGERHDTLVNDATIRLNKGEIIGVAGVSGNGQKELVEALFGMRKISAGSITMGGKDITSSNVKARVMSGLGYIPEERKTKGVAISLSLSLNSVIHSHWGAPYLVNKMFNYTAIRKLAKQIISKFNVAAKSEAALAKNLSGGNLQKFIVGREMLNEPDYLIAVNPTSGLDIGATEYVRKELVDYRNRGKGVLLVSEDLDELLALSDQIVVMYRGSTSPSVNQKDFDRLKIGAMMLGEGFTR